MFAGLVSMGAMSQRNDDPAGASRPFSADRDGFVFGEGAVVLVLESAEHAARRGGRPYAAVAGGALTCDAFHISAPDPDARYATAAIAQALQRSGMRTGRARLHRRARHLDGGQRPAPRPGRSGRPWGRPPTGWRSARPSRWSGT